MPDVNTYHLEPVFYEPDRHADAEPVRRWQADIAAGRIATPARAPGVVAALDAADRLFRCRARRLAQARARA